MKKEYHVLGVFKNGPRFWMYDWIELPVPTERMYIYPWRLSEPMDHQIVVAFWH